MKEKIPVLPLRLQITAHFCQNGNEREPLLDLFPIHVEHGGYLPFLLL
jgi:hypothetical protein